MIETLPEKPMTFADCLARVAEAPESRDNFLTDGRLTWHYRDILPIVERIARHLADNGIAARDCPAIECRNSVPGALALIALLHAGIGFVLLPPSESDDQPSEFKPIPRFCGHRLSVAPVPREHESGWESNPGNFLRIESRAELGQAVLAPDLDTSGKLFLRTSGSMGAAKIVVHAHTGLLGNAQNCVRKYQFTAQDRCVIPVPIFHFYGFGAEFLPALLTGACMDLQGHSNLLRYLDRERRFQPTIAFVTPNLCEMLLKGWKSPRTSYKVIVTSGQRIREDVFRDFDSLCGHRLVNQYGSTEMGATAACDPEDPIDLKATTIGKAMPGVDLRVDCNDETETGELLCRHPFGFLGYVDESGNWLSRAGEWYGTGDVAKIHENGAIEILGRRDNRINRSGYLVLLSDIEKAMEGLEGISQVAIVASAAETIQGQRIIAFCVAESGGQRSGLEIRQASVAVLPKYAVPDEVVLLESLAILPSGKLDRQALVLLAESPENRSLPQA
ncbi:MAG: class I adenylate-forming enzyme family protein [Methylococcales bacterium]